MRPRGACQLCDRVVFTAAGSVREGARRLTVVLVDGSTADFTLCGECRLEPEDFPRLHAKWLEGWQGEPGGMGVARRQRDNVPLGVLYEVPWAEYLGG